MIDPDAFVMTLEEARKVRWLKNDPRPLGELYDEGYLDQARLEWAVARAYNPRLRRAAMVILKQPKPDGENGEAGSETPVRPAASDPALAGANATPWPFSPCRGEPMGALVETRKLTLKDLGYAAESAWDAGVRGAALTLLQRRLGQKAAQPAPSAGFMKWISGRSSFAHRRQMRISLVESLIMGVLFGAALTAFGIYVFTRPASFLSSLNLADMVTNPTGVAALALLVVLVGVVVFSFLLLDRLLDRLSAEIENYRKGEEGEQRTLEVILQSLDGNWTLFRNLPLPGRNKADLDAVLVGPAGLWVFEVKSLSGQYRNTGETWEYRQKNRWIPYRNSPSRQASQGATRLGVFLKADGVRQWIEPAIVWAAPGSLPVVENPSVPVWPLERLPDELGNLWQEEKLPAEVRLHIVDKLTKLCERQEAKKSNP